LTFTRVNPFILLGGGGLLYAVFLV
jgi:hypothetical protein